MQLKTTLFGQVYQFRDVKDVLAKANELRSGDVLAGIAAETAQQRVAAKQVLSEMRLETLRENPVVAYEQDVVTRVIQDAVNTGVYNDIKHWTVSELREYILGDGPSHEDYERLRKGLTSEMVAAVCKICSNGDLMVGGKKLRVVSKANSTVGLPGRFSSRLQPNDTRDDVDSILVQTYEGLAYGCGDAVIGVNPVTESVENTRRILDALQEVIDKWQIPTQGCVLAHVTNQMEAIEKGAPAGLIFQSLSGTEKGLGEFGVTVELLDEAYDLGQHYCKLAGSNMMYFETGQGTALSANAHFGADQVTIEARKYGLAKRYKPHLVNTVVGFIGPEYLFNHQQITRAALEDHFMGKLTGISMGCDACYTNHADTDQNSNENLTVLLAAAGCNYVMSLPMGDDIMLNYQTTGYHDVATVRRLLDYRPAPEFEAWMESMGLMERGELTARAGDPSIFFE
ncbi:ethanolamine ammonia-lyase subunit EutB [Exilibacterium tricleocarpae]|uniref:Ethanolamine ammonia-lyase large subunit n=1 Tax=Exilibacterium tricleocarpae TaxID=2591008 RepID=A0A545TV83_9GAMM|nr:ethanolamine ammonia-lyase subunit EutB [Exilibacterium tricleocarpae]TQV81127.1 ethanolamine ammonia-lyase subunit EutB [Exilibacterium tricleocarpae]